jgi:signal transduction histidine kinase/DNA-binding LacI/PurR family transcriptional regulator/AraC-like DNA-binding protein
VLAGWQFYRSATTLSYLAPVFRGIARAAQELDVNLLLGCGMGLSGSAADPARPAWPFPSPNVDFVPIGPWNTDGLLAINPLHLQERVHAIQQIVSEGHPVLFIGEGISGPAVVADNAGGTRQAIQHLIGHGHEHIAFIAGSSEDIPGDTSARLNAYYAAMANAGLSVDQRLVEFGSHIYFGGYAAMQQIIASGAHFTAVLASNDESALGAMRALKEAGLRIPQDVALMGFDDRPEDVVQEPPLSTIRFSLFNLGYQAVEVLSQHLRGIKPMSGTLSIPTSLIARESCGCDHKTAYIGENLASGTQPELMLMHQQRSMVGNLVGPTTAGVAELAQSLATEEIHALATRLIHAFVVSLARPDNVEFQQALDDVLQRTEASGDDVHIWQEAISFLGHGVWMLSPTADRRRVDQMLGQARLTISARMQRQHRQYVVEQRWKSNCLGLLTAELLNVLEEPQIFDILAQHLPDMGIHFALLTRFEGDAADPVAVSSVRNLIAPHVPPIRITTREFPPTGLLSDAYQDDQRFGLALLPLVNQYGQLGFVTFEVDQLDIYGPIVQQLASALNTTQLYQEATEGRRLAEEANRMKSRFLSTVSHELRTPLNLIVGLSGILLQDQDMGKHILPYSARRDVERIHAQGQHLAGLIGDVLDLASSDSGQLRLTNEYIDLAQVLRIVVETGHQLAAEKGLAWHAELPDAGPWVWGDRTRLRQVAFNLISNAVKFTTSGEVWLQVEADDTTVTITVHDTGLGISPADQEVIFSEFRQSQRTVSRGYGGLGLGLAICKRLIELHGGSIGVRSQGEEGTGSSFYFTLPIVHRIMPEEVPTTPAAKTAALDRAESELMHEQSVLLLTTPTGTSERLRDHLRQHGFDVRMMLMEEPADLPVHLGTLTGTPPDVVVMDVSATSDKVWSLLNTVMGNPAMQGIPSMFYASTQNTGSLLELNYLTKPVRIPELKRAIDRQLPVGEVPVQHTFLVVDDEPNTREMHARIIQSYAPTAQILTAHNGQEALALLRSTQIDLVLLDLMMPEMDGFEVLEAMRALDSTRDIPVIVLTGRLLTESDMARLNRGVANILSKGLFSVEETVLHIGAALEHKRRLSTEAQRLVRKAMAYLHEHYAEPITRRDIAQHVGMVEDHLTHCFRQELGMTPITYLNRYRINRARHLLKHSELSITGIALEVGFSESSYFSRVFRRETGMSPESYRRA